MMITQFEIGKTYKMQTRQGMWITATITDIDIEANQLAFTDKFGKKRIIIVDALAKSNEVN